MRTFETVPDAVEHLVHVAPRQRKAAHGRTCRQRVIGVDRRALGFADGHLRENVSEQLRLRAHAFEFRLNETVAILRDAERPDEQDEEADEIGEHDRQRQPRNGDAWTQPANGAARSFGRPLGHALDQLSLYLYPTP